MQLQPTYLMFSSLYPKDVLIYGLFYPVAIKRLRNCHLNGTWNLGNVSLLQDSRHSYLAKE